MKVKFQPKTHSGKWSIGLFVSSILLVVASMVVAKMQKNTIEFPNPMNSPLLGSL